MNKKSMVKEIERLRKEKTMTSKNFSVVNVMILIGILTVGFSVTCIGFFAGLQFFNVKLGTIFPCLWNIM